VGIRGELCKTVCVPMGEGNKGEGVGACVGVTKNHVYDVSCLQKENMTKVTRPLISRALVLLHPLQHLQAPAPTPGRPPNPSSLAPTPTSAPLELPRSVVAVPLVPIGRARHTTHSRHSLSHPRLLACQNDVTFAETACQARHDYNAWVNVVKPPSVARRQCPLCGSVARFQCPSWHAAPQ